jgi:hypothetical protein
MSLDSFLLLDQHDCITVLKMRTGQYSDSRKKGGDLNHHP